MKIPFVILSVYLAFFVFLLTSGAGYRRALDVLARSALAGVVALVMAIAFPPMVILSFIVLAMMSLRHAREFLVSASSTFQVVCLNVLVVAFGRPPDSYPVIDMLANFGFFLLVDPLAYWLPRDMGWFKMFLQLWPSAIALWVASRGELAPRWARLLLMWWVQLVCVTWTFPAAIDPLLRSLEDPSYSYFALLMATAGLVYVMLTLVTLHVALWGSRREAEYALHAGETAKSAFRRALLEGMVVLQLPTWIHAAGGIAVYLLVNVVRHHLPPDVATTTGFFVILGVSALVGTLVPRGPAWPRAVAVHPLIATGMLAAGLLVLREQPLLPRYRGVLPVQVSQSLEPSRATSTGLEPKGPSERTLEEFLERMPLDMAADCKIEGSGHLRARCGGESWPLASLAHPSWMSVPDRVGPAIVRFTVNYENSQARCVEYPIWVPESPPSDALLLVFVANASLDEQVGWVAKSGTHCRDLRLAVDPDARPGLPTIFFRTDEDEAGDGQARLEPLITLQGQ